MVMADPLRLKAIPLPALLKKNRRKEYALLVLTSFSLGIMSYLSYDWFIYSKSHIETNNAYIDTDIYHIQSRIMGYVKDVFVNEDQAILKSDILLQLDTTDLDLEKKLKESRYRKSMIDFRRAKKLYQSQLVSKSDYENLESLVRISEVDQEATLLKEKFTKIISPANGVIAKAYVKPGQYIQPGQNLFTLVANNKFWIKANYKETQIRVIKQNQTARIEVDAYPGVIFTGHVVGVYPASGSITSLLPAENATGNFTKIVQRVPVKISIDQKPGYILRPGMSVTTSIYIGNEIK